MPINGRKPGSRVHWFAQSKRRNRYTLLLLAGLSNGPTNGFLCRCDLGLLKQKALCSSPLDVNTSHELRNDQTAHEIWYEVGRRNFLISIAGITFLASPSGSASASTKSDVDDTCSVPFKSSSTVLSAVTGDAVPLEDGKITIGTMEIFKKASEKALGGGKAGAAAAILQVSTLMWLRTAMNYQYRFGGSLASSLKHLYSDGGISRLYQGLPFAIIQGPLTRFGDTAANVGILAILESFPGTSTIPLPLKTAAGSVLAGTWRIFLMPIDTSKTVLQVEGQEGFERLMQRVIKSGPSPLYQGAIASAAATAAGHFPWFLTYNFFNDVLPVVSKQDDLLLYLTRSAVLGLSASCVSDCVSNSLRVIKTTKQTASLSVGDDGDSKDISYREAINLVIETDGLQGLFGRGLQTRLLTNAIQGGVFSVLWKYFQDSFT